MSILGASHLAIGVADMDKILPFYVEVLGLRVTSDFTQDLVHHEASAELHKGRHIQRRQVWLRQSDEPHALAIALDQLFAPEPADHRGDIYDLGVHHVGLWVDDIEAIVERARRLGHPVIMPHVSPAAAYGDTGGPIGSVFLRDPEGNLIQCDQRVKPGQCETWRRGGQSMKPVEA